MALRTAIVSLIGLLGLSGFPPSPTSSPLPAANSSPVASTLPQASAPDGALALERLTERCRGLGREEQQRLARVLAAESRQHGLPLELILAVIQVESDYDPFAVSPVGAMGLMQLLPSTAVEVAEQLGVAWVGAQTLFDPVANVRLGVAYLHQLVDRYESVSVALAAYNWGPGRIDRRLRRGSPLPVVYAGRVLDAYGRPGFKTDS